MVVMGGSFQLTGNGTGSHGNAGGLTAFNLNGGVTSARISDNAGNNCTSGCQVFGRTDQILVGEFARALGGSFHGNVQGTFAVNGTYLLEQSALMGIQPTVSSSSGRISPIKYFCPTSKQISAGRNEQLELDDLRYKPL